MTTPADEPVADTDSADPSEPAADTPPGVGSAISRVSDSAIADAELDDTDIDDADLDGANGDGVDIDAGDDDAGDIEADDDAGADGEFDDPDLDERDGMGSDADNLDVEADDSGRTDAMDDSGFASDGISARIPPAPAAAPARVTDIDDVDGDVGDSDFVPSRRGRGGYDPEADAIARAARYTFRQRAVLALLLAMIAFAACGVALSSQFWLASGLAMLTLGSYLAYLRKQVRWESDIRRRRSARLLASRQGGRQAGGDQHLSARDATQQSMDRDTARALRRRSVLLDPDDGDPVFEHLETFDIATARALRNRTGDLRRAVGE